MQFLEASGILMDDDLGVGKGGAEFSFDRVGDLMGASQIHRAIHFEM